MSESKESIVTLCGHLYCWSCILEWSQSKNNKIIPCPICNAEVDVSKVIPLYCSKEEHEKKSKNIPQ